MNLKIIKEFFDILEKEEKKNLIILTLYMNFSGILEAISVGLLIPFMTFMLDPTMLTNNEWFTKFQHIWSIRITSNQSVIMFSTCFYVFVILCSVSFKFYLLKRSTNFTFSLSKKLNSIVFKSAISIDYQDFININSSSILDAISTKINAVIYGGVQPIMNFLTSLFLILFITVSLFFINTTLTILAFTFLIVIYLLIYLIFRKRVKAISLILPSRSTQALRTVQEAIGSIRDIKINHNENLFYSKFYRSIEEYIDAQSESLLLNTSPYIFIQGLLILVMVAFLFFSYLNNKNIITLIPIVSAFALGALKLLPQIQILYSTFTNINSSEKYFSDILEIIRIKSINNIAIQSSEKLEFNKSIKIRNLCYSYKGSSEFVLKSLNFEIKKNQFSAISGKSGVGKSTLVDIVMGLITKYDGQIIIDDITLDNSNRREWQNNIGHVPQFIYLFDENIYINISLVEKITDVIKQNVDEILNQIGLEEFIVDNPIYAKKLGERGVNVSGGQRQRIGIARALYRKPSILILDESTNALDIQSELDILTKIREDKNITVLIISHRKETLSVCDNIINLS